MKGRKRIRLHTVHTNVGIDIESKNHL